jgi:hypothetical protein
MRRLETFLGSDGKYHHDGDCWIYAINGVCTCGLLHIVNRDADNPDYKCLMENLWKHEGNLHYLNNIEIPKREPISDEKFKEIMEKAGWKV